MSEKFRKLGDECLKHLKEINPSGGIKDFIRMAVEFGYKKATQTCQNCKFNCKDDHTRINDCNVGSYYAGKGLNKICYEGELWETNLKGKYEYR